MAHRHPPVMLAIGVVLTSLAMSACAGAPRQKPLPIGRIETGPGSVAALRKALEGTWKLASLEVVNPQGVSRRITAGGELTYDAFGNMTIRGVIEDAALKDTLVLDYTGRILIDPVRHEFYPAALVSERPVDAGQIAPVSPDKVRRYELTADSLVVTYLDAASGPTAVARWRR